MIPNRNSLRREQVGVEQRRLALALAAHQPPGQPGHRDRADRDQRGDGLAAFLPHQDAEHDAAHAEHGQDGADEVDAPGSGVRDVVDELDARQHDRDDDDLEQERDPPRQVRGDEAAEQRPDGGGDRRRGADQRVDLRAARLLRSCRGSATASPAAAATRRARRSTAQKMMIAVRLWASVIASAPTA